MDWYNEKKTTDQYAEEKRWIFTFDFKKKEEKKRERWQANDRERVVVFTWRHSSANYLPLCVGSTQAAQAEARQSGIIYNVSYRVDGN